MLVSECCNMKAFFGFGESYGLQLTKEGVYIGLCGECRERTEFYFEEDNNNE